VAEKLRTNKTESTLFVGVGGIGSDIVVRIAEKCKDNELDNLKFVCMDTDANSLRGVANSKAVITKIQTSSSQSVRDYLANDDDARLNWFPNNTTLYEKTVSEGAGQVRAISRLALNKTIKTNEIQPLYDQIDSLFNKDVDDLKRAFRVVIVSSATGGTGSGMAMITGMLIREYLREHYSEKSPIIRGFFVLPSVMDTVISTQTERESQYRNGYSTIKEINAFMMTASGFADTEKALHRYRDLHIDVPTASGGSKALKCLPFDFCFLLERADKNVENMDELDSYKDYAAQSLYEQSIGPMQKIAFSLEDNVIKEFANEGNHGRNRFGGIGSSVIRYPYEMICDYIAFSKAIDRIGGDRGEWAKYDKAYHNAMKEFKKKRATTGDKEPTRSSIYTAAVDGDNTLFGQDVRASISSKPNVRNAVSSDITLYTGALRRYVLTSFKEMNEVSIIDTGFEQLKSEQDYKEAPGTANDNLYTIRSYESIIRRSGRDFARNLAKSIFFEAPPIFSGNLQQYHVESLLKTREGAINPNALRYVLYLLSEAIEKNFSQEEKKRKKCENDLLVFADTANDPDKFDFVHRTSKEKECRVDEVVALENKDPGFFEKIGGRDKLWTAINNHLTEYANAVSDYRDAVLMEAVYGIAREYIASLNKAFERFFESFDNKALMLQRKKTSIVDTLKYRSGDVVYNLCATEEMLNEILRRTPDSDDGLLLPDDLNMDIFETAKKNAAYQRLSEVDPFTEDTSIDIFDDVLIGYFRNSIRESNEDILDLDVVSAIRLDEELTEFIKLNELREEKDYIMPPKKRDDSDDYIFKIIQKGKKLATPGISGVAFAEPRENIACTFNECLCDRTDFNMVKALMKHKFQPVPSDTTSKYDLRFFSALYNITPDKIPLFKGPKYDAVTGKYNFDAAGVYYKSYTKYSRKIGPDSMKSSTISTHIDKRWDTVVELPEIDMEVHNDDMMRIHSSLIYGLVLDMIRRYPSSGYDKGKRVFKLENMDGDLINLTVSNGTDCDEFYEVLDALYRDNASSTMILDVVEAFAQKDINKNHRYNESSFVKNLEALKIGDYHEAPTSLFEIPLCYYNSLPSSLADDNELSVMIDSVIMVLENEIKKYEKEEDRKPYLCQLLEEQFALLVKAFNNDEYEKKYELRNNTVIEENLVIGMTYRKIVKHFRSMDLSDCDERIERLRKMKRSDYKG
jgi:hypothetical protein